MQAAVVGVRALARVAVGAAPGGSRGALGTLVIIYCPIDGRAAPGAPGARARGWRAWARLPGGGPLSARPARRARCRSRPLTCIGYMESVLHRQQRQQAARRPTKEHVVVVGPLMRGSLALSSTDMYRLPVIAAKPLDAAQSHRKKPRPPCSAGLLCTCAAARRLCRSTARCPSERARRANAASRRPWGRGAHASTPRACRRPAHRDPRHPPPTPDASAADARPLKSFLDRWRPRSRLLKQVGTGMPGATLWAGRGAGRWQVARCNRHA